MIGYNSDMPQRTADPRSNAAAGVCASTLPEQLPDDPAALKALYWHRNGFCLWYKRLEAEHFAWPAAEAGEATCVLTMKEFEWLLEGFDLWAAKPHKTLHYQSVT